MADWRQFFIHGMNMFSVLIVAYFFLANGTYTVLLIRSLVWISIHNHRKTCHTLAEIRESSLTPPVTIIMPAWNEEEVIVESLRSVLQLDYPRFEIVVVLDGSVDHTLERLIAAFRLTPIDLIYRPRLNAHPVRGFYSSPSLPGLLVIEKEHGGKPDSLNVGLNMCRTPYFATLDSDCVLERTALLQLIRPVLQSPEPVVVSGGTIRILNGCHVRDGRVAEIRLPATFLERFQVVEYLRSFLYGRLGWNLLQGTLIVSGAFALFHHETVLSVGGFGEDTVTEDMDIIVQLHRSAVLRKRRIKVSFTPEPVCWTQCPSSLGMLARQRRRWQLGLCQTLWKNSEMLLNRHYGAVGLFSFPFYVYVEGLGAAIELLGYLMVPFVILLGIAPPALFVLFVSLSLAYGGLLSVGAVLLEELTLRRYPRLRDLMMLILVASLENAGFRQLVLWFRFQGIVRFVLGFRKWERVAHTGTV